MKKRINMSIGPDLHAEAVSLAESREMNLSALICDLLRREIAHSGKKHPVTPRKVVTVRQPVQKGSARCLCGSGKKFKACCGK